MVRSTHPVPPERAQIDDNEMRDRARRVARVATDVASLDAQLPRREFDRRLGIADYVLHEWLSKPRQGFEWFCAEMVLGVALGFTAALVLMVAK